MRLYSVTSPYAPNHTFRSLRCAPRQCSTKSDCFSPSRHVYCVPVGGIRSRNHGERHFGSPEIQADWPCPQLGRNSGYSSHGIGSMGSCSCVIQRQWVQTDRLHSPGPPSQPSYTVYLKSAPGIRTQISYTGGGIGLFDECNTLWFNIVDQVTSSYKPLWVQT